MKLREHKRQTPSIKGVGTKYGEGSFFSFVLKTPLGFSPLNNFTCILISLSSRLDDILNFIQKHVLSTNSLTLKTFFHSVQRLTSIGLRKLIQIKFKSLLIEDAKNLESVDYRNLKDFRKLLTPPWSFLWSFQASENYSIDS